MTRSFVVASTAALTVALVLTGIACIHSYFIASILATAPKCAVLELLDGRPTVITDIWGLPLFGAFAAFMIWRIGRSKRTKDILIGFDLPGVQNFITKNHSRYGWSLR